MSPRARWIAALAALAVASLLAAPFLIRWSRSCEEELTRATAAWRAYGEGLPASRARALAREIERRIARDPSGALEATEDPGLAPPEGDRGAARRYREAMETLALAEGACGAAP